MPSRKFLLPVLLSAGLLACCCGYPVTWAVACYAPRAGAVPAARKAGEAHGYRLDGPSLVTASGFDPLGGCEVRAIIVDSSAGPDGRDVFMRLRRSWAFGEWAVVEIKEAPPNVPLPPR